MTRVPLGIAAILLLIGTFLSFSPLTLQAGSPEQVRSVVDLNLTIQAGETVVSSPVDLRGYATWAFQVTVRSGDGTNLAWQSVYRYSAELDWTPRSSDTFVQQSPYAQDAVAPFGAVQLRNLGGLPVSVAISAFLDKVAPYAGYHVTSDRTIVGATHLMIPPGQFRFSDTFDLSGGNLVAYQLSFPSGRPSATVQSTVQAKIFTQQAFGDIPDNGGPRHDRVGNFGAVFAPLHRLKVTNASPNPIEVVVGAYTLTTD